MLRTLSGILLLLLLCSLSSSGQPRLSLEGGTSFDFGKLYRSPAKKNLTLRNVGTDSLRVTRVSASCGCTGVLMSNEWIPPGASGTLAITFDAKRFNGPVDKVVSFETNDSTQKHVTVTFHATVVKSLEFDPEYFYLPTVADSHAVREMTVRNSSPTRIRITSLKSSSPNVKVSASKTDLDPGEDAVLKCEASFPDPGTYRGHISIQTTFAEAPADTLSFFSFVKKRPGSK